MVDFRHPTNNDLTSSDFDFANCALAWTHTARECSKIGEPVSESGVRQLGALVGQALRTAGRADQVEILGTLGIDLDPDYEENEEDLLLHVHNSWRADVPRPDAPTWKLICTVPHCGEERIIVR